MLSLCLGFTWGGEPLVGGGMNFVRDRSGHICSLVGGLLSRWAGKLGLSYLNLKNTILSLKRAVASRVS